MTTTKDRPLTAREVAALKPRTERYEVPVGDPKLPGLVLRVQPSGAKSWSLAYRVGRLPARHARRLGNVAGAGASARAGRPRRNRAGRRPGRVEARAARRRHFRRAGRALHRAVDEAAQAFMARGRAQAPRRGAPAR
jgi:hypothetical protein